MKKLLSLCLALCMAFTLAAPAFADAPSAGQVLAPSGEMDAVYYNPTTGQDGNTGESGSPVASFTKALSLVKSGGTIYVNGQIEFRSGVTTLSNVTLQRGEGYTGIVLMVQGSGTALTVTDVTVDGANSANANLLVMVQNGAKLTIAAGSKVCGHNGIYTAVTVETSPEGAPSVLEMTGGEISGNRCSDNYAGGVQVNSRCTFELSGGVIKNNTALDSGGGVRVVDQASFVMTGGEISGNQATYSGGGVLCSGKAELRGGEIKNNTAGWGAGVAVWGGVNAQAVLTVSDTASIIGNQANGNGAGVYVEDSLFNMTGGAITGNITETGSGGGLFGYHYGRDTVLKISGGTISDNQAPGTGSGTAVTLNGDSDYARLELSGAPDIGGDVFLRDDNFPDIQVEVTGAFTPAQPVVLSLTQLDDDGKQVISYAEGATSSANAFMSKNQGYIINAEGVLVKVVQVPNPITPDTAVTLDKTELELAPGQTAKLKASLTPADATYKYIFWTSSDEAVATVSDSGLVTAVADGTAAITAKSWYGHEVVCTVTVKTPEEPTPPEPVDPWPTEGLEGFVTRCYRVALGRDPDKAGHADWVRWLQNGTVDATTCTYGFVFSKEMNNKNLSDEAFVKTLYNLFMDREGEATGVAFWTSYLNGGHSREEVFQGFADSAEFARIKTSYGLG